VTATAPALPKNGTLEALIASIQAFARMTANSRAVESVLRRLEIDLTRADIHLLRTLGEAEEPIRLGDLAERLVIDAPSVTRRVQALESRQLLRRQPDPADKRAQRIELTATGRRALEQAMVAYRHWIAQVTADWSEADRAQLAHLLERLTASIAAEIG
jgi:DNA-binding MarR family transcriptional regulator